ncbi:MAG: BamA/TamA family outer membrane protein [Paludibacteraceae bacterium]|nr:BamA/TamA family outer membrane protein [Paludibacteraceae bacterium]
MKHLFIYITFLLFIGLTACQTTKYVPEGKYLLDKVAIKSDVKNIPKSEIKSYLRQTPNASILGFWKLQLDIYNLSKPDTTKWINRSLRKIGDAPEIYNPNLTSMSLYQIERFMNNKGYFDAQVSSDMQVKKRKAKLTYIVKGNSPYVLQDYHVDLQQEDLQRIASDTTTSFIKRGMLFDSNVLDAERARITKQMKNLGFYFFEKDYLAYQADSALGTNSVNLQLHLSNNLLLAPDSVREKLFTKCKIKSVSIHTDYDPLQWNRTAARGLDTLRRDDYLISYGKKRNFRPQALISNCLIIPGQYYSMKTVEDTYVNFNAMPAIKYVNILFREVEPGWLHCVIVTTPAKTQAFSVEGEGTYSAGDFGVAGTLGYQHNNLFRGSEQLSIEGRAAYEWRKVGGNALEVGVDASLGFPSFLVPFSSKEFRKRDNAKTNINLSYNFQNRPLEYSRTIAGAGINYSWFRNPAMRHSFDFVDFSYVYLPWISDEFKNYFLNNQSVLKYSYEDHFIMRWGYNGSYSTYNERHPLKNYLSMRYGVETAGNLLYGINHLFKMQPSEDGSYKVFNIRYSQYAKADFDIAYHQIIDENNRFVYHASIGVGVPYGNSASLPFEKRYYSGGANSVRGWSVRTLGPGTFKTEDTRIDFNNQSGDIKLDLNMEYRVKMVSVLEGALFLDAGNIWTIREYETQIGGAFHFDTFYKQIAVAYGLGLRLNLSFFILRLDFGVKLHDPALPEEQRWRMKPKWKDDMAFHFAIGYPF